MAGISVQKWALVYSPNDFSICFPTLLKFVEEITNAVRSHLNYKLIIWVE